MAADEKANRKAAAWTHRGWNTTAEKDEVLGTLAAARAVYLERGGR